MATNNTTQEDTDNNKNSQKDIESMIVPTITKAVKNQAHLSKDRLKNIMNNIKAMGLNLSGSSFTAMDFVQRKC